MGSVVYGQTDTLPSYFFESGEVVLEFDIRQYDKKLKKNFKKLFELKEFDVIDLIKHDAPDSIQGWKVKQLNDFVFQLRCDLDLLMDQEMPKEVKYLIDGDYWVHPVSEPDSTSESSISFSDEYDLFASPYRIAENGNTTFSVDGHPKAKKVILAGSFNNWNEEEIKMHQQGNGWVITLDLKPGIYEYKFIVDGNWNHDIKNPLYVLNQHETLNSILLVGKTITFNLPGYLEAEQVILSGSFNNWNEDALLMKATERGWIIELPLPPGKHYYKFVIDDKWIIDPDNELQEPDSMGHWNSVKVVN